MTFKVNFIRLPIPGVPNHEGIPQEEFQGSLGNLYYTLSNSDCWNIYLLADLPKVIPVIV